MSIIYTAHATAIGGRTGKVSTDDGKIAVPLSSPGTGGAGTNPEQLFASGYGACFSGACQYLAKQQGLDLGDIEVKTDVNLHKGDDGFKLSAALDVTLPNLDHDAAVKLVTAAHDFCPYSKATRGNIEVTLKVNGQEIHA